MMNFAVGFVFGAFFGVLVFALVVAGIEDKAEREKYGKSESQ